ncbi:MAG: DUF1893 domain-containing protein [Phocaeicola sp.]|uniref:DUF1893 domain-containing protein n=1 Tax=Phocaeicola sp. TaxID=2773926 RepID=UPI003F9F922A
MGSETIEALYQHHCSLVVNRDGELYFFHKKGVRDLEDLLNNTQQLLNGSELADKVIGKAAAGMIVEGKVKEVYADILSRKAVPLLEKADIPYSYGKLVDRIIIPEGDTRCPLEQIVGKADTAEEVVRLLRKHFAEMNQFKH